ncbi:MAG: hypothetical protein JSU59_02850 [Nitrospirota bacterium]|nr:MAG: hypothetical protein JSU59_02850 [Nitrospirota bacterium]
MRPSLLTHPVIWIILAVGVAGDSLSFAQNGPSPDQDSSSPPPVFQPGEIQHGFSEFDSLPEIPPDDPPSFSPPVASDPEGNVPHDPNQKPAGLFFQMEFAEGFEEEQGIRKGHMVIPINPTNEFSSDTRAVYLVFSVFKHYAPYQVFGRLYPEKVDNQDPTELLDEDTMYLAAEDESGYLQFFPQSGRWTPGTYQVKIFVGWETSELNQRGTMRFSITSGPSPLASSPETE